VAKVLDDTSNGCTQSLADILVEELHNHLYLKSLYCNDRWKAYSTNKEGMEPIPLYDAVANTRVANGSGGGTADGISRLNASPVLS
jgi:hypothetical protein